MGAAAVLGRDDPEHREPVAVGARPAREELGHGRVQPELRRPRLGEVVVDLTVRHRRDDRIRGRVVALHEQDPLRRADEARGRRSRNSTPVSPGIRWSAISSATGSGRSRELPQPSESCLGTDRADDARVGREPPAQVGLQRAHDRGIGRDDEDDRQLLGCAVVRRGRCFDVLTLWCSHAGANTCATCACPQGCRPSSF